MSDEPAITRGQPWRDITIRVRDGLNIYGRHYPAPGSCRRPALCLAGLTRNSRDFHELALALAGTGDGARDVFTMDTRGRGRSDHAASWRDYTVPIEMFDVQDFMAANQLHDAAVIGTSRGGLVAMVMAAAQPSLIGAVVLNDVGPVIERTGLMRISGYVGNAPSPVTWQDAAAQVERAGSEFFPDVESPEWEAVARQLYNEENGKPVQGYDPAIAKSFSAIADGRVPELWPQFQALSHTPCLVLRGELSDLLSEATTHEMARRHPDCSLHTVPGQGHAPLLRDRPTQQVIRDFLIAQDGR